MTTGNDPISMLMRQHNKLQTTENEQSIAKAFEVVFKIIFWIVDRIPFINTWFLNRYNNTMPDAAAKKFKKENLIQLKAFPCPSYLTASQIAHLQPKIAKHYQALIMRSAQAPQYSLCYSTLGVISDYTCNHPKRPCDHSQAHDSSINALHQKVSAFYQSHSLIHVGAPAPEKRPPLSSDFISVCVTILPPLPLTELYIHGPIVSNHDRSKLKTIILTTKTLATLHLEVEATSATYFTAKAQSMLERNHTITVFNLSLMGKKCALTFDAAADPWTPLNTQNRCTLQYTNVQTPDGFIPNALTFN